MEENSGAKSKTFHSKFSQGWKLSAVHQDKLCISKLTVQSEIIILRVKSSLNALQEVTVVKQCFFIDLF